MESRSEVEIGAGTNWVLCRRVGRTFEIQWFSKDPVPPAGTRVTVQWIFDQPGANMLRYPPRADT